MEQIGNPGARDIQTLMELSYKTEFPQGIPLTGEGVRPLIILLVYTV